MLGERINGLVHPHHRKTAGEFIRFGCVGAFNTVLDFSIYFALTRGFDFWGRHFVFAAAVSFGFAVTSSFLLNNFWTFRRDAGAWHSRGAKFLLVALTGLAWNSAILYGLTLIGVHDLVAKLAATGAVMLWNFTLHKTWTFRDA